MGFHEGVQRDDAQARITFQTVDISLVFGGVMKIGAAHKRLDMHRDEHVVKRLLMQGRERFRKAKNVHKVESFFASMLSRLGSGVK